jgi:hypothetical protein
MFGRGRRGPFVRVLGQETSRSGSAARPREVAEDFVGGGVPRQEGEPGRGLRVFGQDVVDLPELADIAEVEFLVCFRGGFFPLAVRQPGGPGEE